MTQLKNDRYLKALLREPVDMTPVWMMRQAGRYLPEYKATRAQAGDFMSLCRNADLACEVTLQPLRRYALDAAILFSDILTIPDAMGLGLSFGAGEGPKFARPIENKIQVDNLPIPDPEGELQYVMNAVRTIRHELKGEVPLIGFSGSPWTLATYMVEGGSSKAFTKIKKMMYADPQILHALLDKLADSVILYLNAQIKAGAQAVMVFDTWGGVLAHEEYKTFSLQYMQKIVEGLIRENEGRKVPVTLFTKGGGLWLEAIAETGCDAVGLDWTVDIREAKKRVGHKVALQGNMDPSVLYAPAARIEQEVKNILAGFGEGSGHVFNLGHGIHQDVPTESPKVFVNAIHEFSKQYHK
ncbi:uroporphyrinogen decarboxylase [Haemophilus parahaemolyticus]|uniref:Uroporphyrinogen decarboxylase n=2 Tax=Haemophilus parahaemolyticus TaxID=735 RepID=A0AAE6JQM4_HAEPH|nr:uroporphyrinogen decarboxylase [Haemophilus parahaemolyticus]EIJ69600.1 uroporphyrinogen decarboxylase [Haemophilus parahaemolyticus HK385]OOR96913.1 uroporphyrinogen decarboxylase [Haemophilus parahaemolyticus]QEN10399.1 uroporphyrinogen decarboxylase [Haemophilus parahaemolyticus]QRP13386.1 uroporphyrinogen decarboxylase [Haemophilus parahaemolyticus]STO65737.1 uroporphyrinogen decarboxylase [Haemophilus parahaemolyticus HK385]